MRILLDPASDGAFGLLLLVPAKTGIVVEHQVNGIATEVRETEGFLLPLAGEAKAITFKAWFGRQSTEMPEPRDWTDGQLQELDGLLADIASYGPDDQRGPLSLDYARRTEIVEGWIPVQSVLGPAVLIFENSD